MGSTNKSCCCGVKLPAYLGFAILGLVNTIIPFIVYSANYLIIPYPQWIVLFIETVPALITKIFLPHVIHRVPYWMRPLSVGACWILVGIITKATPPNVAPPARVFTSILASSAAAAMDVSFLGMTRYYGKAGLAGWGAGVGAGALFCAVLPFVLTVRMEVFLRSCIDLIYALTGAMLFAFFVILPGAPVNYPHTLQNRQRKSDVEDGQEGSIPVINNPLEELNRLMSVENRLGLIDSLMRSSIIPLLIAFATQTIVFPGITRALFVSPVFESFFAFSTAYGFAFQLGSFMSRTLTPIFRLKSTGLAFVILNLAAIILLANVTFAFFTSSTVAVVLAWSAGAMGGCIWVTIMGNVLEESSSEPGINQEFCLQVVGAGEVAGVIFGHILGAFLEGSVCNVDVGPTASAVQRWCRTNR
ncbi:batten's disease protein Cln3 [Mariannaea sp. PMI_226]|nr:batten's disease protein Cln3 [Mariannaea sp. PMI_226]